MRARRALRRRQRDPLRFARAGDGAAAPLAYRVFRDGRPLVERDHAALVKLKARAILDDLDFKPVEELCAAGVLRAAATLSMTPGRSGHDPERARADRSLDVPPRGHHERDRRLDEVTRELGARSIKPIFVRD